jgi:hypothetical protein
LRRVEHGLQCRVHHARRRVRASRSHGVPRSRSPRSAAGNPDVSKRMHGLQGMLAQATMTRMLVKSHLSAAEDRCLQLGGLRPTDVGYQSQWCSPDELSFCWRARRYLLATAGHIMIIGLTGIAMVVIVRVLCMLLMPLPWYKLLVGFAVYRATMEIGDWWVGALCMWISPANHLRCFFRQQVLVAGGFRLAARLRWAGSCALCTAHREAVALLSAGLSTVSYQPTGRLRGGGQNGKRTGKKLKPKSPSHPAIARKGLAHTAPATAYRGQLSSAALRAALRGAKTTTTPPKGACLFHALLQQVGEDSWAAAWELREQVAEYVHRNWNDESHFCGLLQGASGDPSGLDWTKILREYSTRPMENATSDTTAEEYRATLLQCRLPPTRGDGATPVDGTPADTECPADTLTEWCGQLEIAVAAKLLNLNVVCLVGDHPKLSTRGVLATSAHLPKVEVAATFECDDLNADTRFS